jgi:integrase/recombinase XerD
VRPLVEQADRYLAVRTALGYRLRDDAGLVKALAGYADSVGGGRLSTAVALRWASAAGSDSTHQRRLSVARGFAAYMRAFDPATEIPPMRLGPLVDRRPRRPHIYTDDEVAALMAAAREGEPALTASSASGLIGLAAACGLRPAELYRLRCADIDLRAGRVAVMESKRARSRLLPLHPSAVDALASHLKLRRGVLTPAHDICFVAATGAPISAKFPRRFQMLAERAGISTRPGEFARVGDLRHIFAVATLLGWHRAGVDVGRKLPWLSAYLGHLCPESTYWYLEAVPELMAMAAHRLADTWN